MDGICDSETKVVEIEDFPRPKCSKWPVSALLLWSTAPGVMPAALCGHGVPMVWPCPSWSAGQIRTTNLQQCTGRRVAIRVERGPEGRPAP